MEASQQQAAAVTVTVRVSMHWDVQVPAVYGDTEQSLIEKASVDGKAPDNVTRNVVG